MISRTPGEAPILEVAQEASPALQVLLLAFTDAEDLPVAVGADADRRQYRNTQPAAQPRQQGRHLACSRTPFSPAKEACVCQQPSNRICAWRAGAVAVDGASPVKLSVVVPVYRSQQTLPDLHRRIVATLEPIEPAFEILLVEDCGGDDSWETIESLAALDSRVRGIKLSRNFGQHAATICGISKARGDWILTLDDDLEQPPEQIPALIAKAREGYAVVYGIYETRTHHWWRNLTSELARRLFALAIPSLNHEYTSFRLVARGIASKLVDFDSPFPFVDGYLSWLTNNYATVLVRHDQRAHGASNYNVRRLLTHTINIFVTFSDLPLRIASWIGLCASLVGLGWLSYLLLRFFLGGITVSGYASVMAGIILFGGIQLLILGIFGEYLGRMNFKSSRKPLFLIGVETPEQAK
jgi:undecaprenyl-phosphate 4-deoxy-4-formamido-L-arabinose transferase